MTKVKYPPCSINPATEKAFTRHKWVIKDHLTIRPGNMGYQDHVWLYKVVCERCGYNDPKPLYH